jgi:hypothetical protein
MRMESKRSVSSPVLADAKRRSEVPRPPSHFAPIEENHYKRGESHCCFIRGLVVVWFHTVGNILYSSSPWENILLIASEASSPGAAHPFLLHILAVMSEKRRTISLVES